MIEKLMESLKKVEKDFSALRKAHEILFKRECEGIDQRNVERMWGYFFNDTPKTYTRRALILDGKRDAFYFFLMESEPGRKALRRQPADGYIPSDEETNRWLNDKNECEEFLKIARAFLR